jgi:hypothetical protein
MRNRWLLLATLTAAAFLAACGSVKIGRINADPTRFQNRTVHVNGKVVVGMGVLGKGGYQIEDDTGRIFVISTTGIPSRGSQVTVTGRVIAGANVLGTPVGNAIREHEHKVH